MKHFEIYKKDPATGALYPEGQRRKKGLARILEIVVRDFWQLLGSGLIATAAALPYGLCIMLFLPSSALGPLILSCVVTGALASVFGMNLLDTILRCLIHLDDSVSTLSWQHTDIGGIHMVSAAQIQKCLSILSDLPCMVHRYSCFCQGNRLI